MPPAVTARAAHEPSVQSALFRSSEPVTALASSSPHFLRVPRSSESLRVQAAYASRAARPRPGTGYTPPVRAGHTVLGPTADSGQPRSVTGGLTRTGDTRSLSALPRPAQLHTLPACPSYSVLLIPAFESRSLTVVAVDATNPSNLNVTLRYGPSGSGRTGTRIVGCSPDKPMLSIVAREANGYKAEGFSRQRVLSNEQQ